MFIFVFLANEYGASATFKRVVIASLIDREEVMNVDILA